MDELIDLSSIVAVIPAYNPSAILLDTLSSLIPSGLCAIIVVDDGSDPTLRSVFDKAEKLESVHVLRHAVNLGKGAALKTAINHALWRFPEAVGAITADADGQHHPDDIVAVGRVLAANPNELILGVRQFRGGIPARSKFGNNLTRSMFRLLYGQDILDTQTGLRGIPAQLAKSLLKLDSNGYEFELDMLIVAKQLGISIRQEPIRTIYLEGNLSSHFNPILDSMRIYFVLLRFSAASLITALFDNTVFYLMLAWTGSALPAQVVSRFLALILNYNLNRKAVFFSSAKDRGVLLKYLLTVFVSGSLSYLLLVSMHNLLAMPLFQAKLAAESLLFLANFAFLRDFVFVRKQADSLSTDWTAYYRSVPPTAKLTRKYTARTIVEGLSAAGLRAHEHTSIFYEFGGANSCFIDAIAAAFEPAEYHVVDNNAYGLRLLSDRAFPFTRVVLHNQDIMDLQLPSEADVVYSIGLIEHFNPAGTADAIRSHFQFLKPGGYALISFPYPTWLYRATRGFLEIIGMWKFPDERPLQAEEVIATSRELGEVVWRKTLWPLMLTQHMLLIRKNSVTQT